MTLNGILSLNIKKRRNKKKSSTKKEIRLTNKNFMKNKGKLEQKIEIIEIVTVKTIKGKNNIEILILIIIINKTIMREDFTIKMIGRILGTINKIITIIMVIIKLKAEVYKNNHSLTKNKIIMYTKVI